MTFFLKRLLVSLALIAGFSGFAQAQAIYDFTVANTYGAGFSGYFTSVAGANESGTPGYSFLNSFTYTSGGTGTVATGNIGRDGGTSSPLSYLGRVDPTGLLSPAAVYSDGHPGFSGLSFIGGGTTSGGINYGALGVSYSGTSLYITDGSEHLVAATFGVAAPEIDGSLLAKAAFLLGCLFLVFGRKKPDSAPVLTA